MRFTRGIWRLTRTGEAETRLPAPYWRLWLAGAVDNIGDGAFVAAVPLLAVRLSPSPVLISAISAVAFLPWVLFSLPIGAMVDRYDRRRLMVRAQLVQALIMAGTVAAIAAGVMNIGLLVLVAFALGTCDVLFDNAAQAILPDLVAAPLLHRANGYHNTVIYLGEQFIGPPVGSALFAILAPVPFGLNAVSFAGSAALVATLPRSAPPPAGRRPPMRAAIGEGLRWLFRHRQLRTLAMLLAANTFCFAMGSATLVLLATRTLHISTGGYGLLLAAAAIGGAIGGVVNAGLVARLGTLPALLVCLGTMIVLFEAIGIAPNLVVLGILLAVGGFATTIWNVLVVTLRQQQVPDALRGRVNSAFRMVGWGLIPLGALAGGLVADTLGLRAPYPIAGALRAIALLVALPVLIATTKPGTADRGSAD